MKRAFDFASIGFRPYNETGEFVTVGVVAYDSASRQFGYRLLPTKRKARIRGLFPHLTRLLFVEAMRSLEAEMKGLDAAMTVIGGDVPIFQAFVQDQGGMFNALTSPKQGLFFFPKKGRRLADNLDEVLTTLEDRLIYQNEIEFIKPVEGEIEKQIRSLLKQEKLLKAYKRNVKVGPPEFQVLFPLVRFENQSDRRPDRAIRPLNFDLPTSTEIFNHGDEWTQRLKRLERLRFSPQHCLIAVRPPFDPTDTLRQIAFRDIATEFELMGIQLATEKEGSKIVAFARFPEPPLSLAAG